LHPAIVRGKTEYDAFSKQVGIYGCLDEQTQKALREIFNTGIAALDAAEGDQYVWECKKANGKMKTAAMKDTLQRGSYGDCEIVSFKFWSRFWAEQNHRHFANSCVKLDYKS
jgi:hypothetical protein